MKAIGILLLVSGGIGFLLGTIMYGDIGIAAIIGAVGSILSGIGFLIAEKKIEGVLKKDEQ